MVRTCLPTRPVRQTRQMSRHSPLRWLAPSMTIRSRRGSFPIPPLVGAGCRPSSGRCSVRRFPSVRSTRPTMAGARRSGTLRGHFRWAGTPTRRLGLTTTRLIGLRVMMCAQGLLYFASHHPKERHWYLQMLGTEPASQSRGLGSAILGPVLDRCDREGERVYLESSKERNIPFYARHGFEVTQEIQVPRGPVVWAMWREPR